MFTHNEAKKILSLLNNMENTIQELLSYLPQYQNFRGCCSLVSEDLVPVNKKRLDKDAKASLERTLQRLIEKK